MKKLLPALFAFSLLTGCGTHGVVGAASISSASVAAQSKANAEKAIHAIFKAAFKAADKNKDGKLTLDEMPGALPTAAVPGAAPAAQAAAADAKATFAKLDAKKQGFVGYREFCSTANEEAALSMFRFQVGVAFAQLDKNGDRVLTADELVGTPFGSLKIDANKHGKIALSDFEDAFSATFATTPDPVDPAAPPAPPAPPAPADGPAAGPANPPAPPAPPAPAAPTKAKK